MRNSEESNETCWFAKPQKPGDGTQHTSLEKRILKELIVLEKLEHLNRQDNQSLSNFNWTDSTLDKQAHQAIEESVVEFQDIFARHTLNIGIEKDLKLKLTRIDENSASNQNLPTPINLKKDITTEIALLQKTAILPL